MLLEVALDVALERGDIALDAPDHVQVDLAVEPPCHRCASYPSGREPLKGASRTLRVYDDGRLAASARAARGRGEGSPVNRAERVSVRGGGPRPQRAGLCAAPRGGGKARKRA